MRAVTYPEFELEGVITVRIPGLVLTVLVLAATAARAQDRPDHLAAAEELLEVTEMAARIDDSIDIMLAAQLDANPALANYEDVLRSFLVKHIGWEAMRGDIAKMYVESFTEAELRTLSEFYKTPVGRKAVRLLPELMARGARVGQERVQEHMAELQELVLQRKKELEGE